MNLVVGATGYLGSEICRLLTTAGKPVRALVRSTADPAKINVLKSMGATFVQGDLKDRASLDAACRGATTVISTASSTISRQQGDSIQTVDLDGQLRLIDAARTAGVKHFLYVSFSGNLRVDHPLHTAKRTVEEHLKKSGLTYTILRPTYYMEVWLSPIVGFDIGNAKAQIYGNGESKISWISFRDVAKFAVQCLDNPAAMNATFDLGGPEALSPLEVVKIFEEVGMKPFAVQHVPVEVLEAQKAAATDPLQQSFAGMMIAYAKGDPVDMRDTLKKVPVELSSVRDYARQMLTR